MPQTTPVHLGCATRDADDIEIVHCPSGFLTVAAPICWNSSSRFSSSQCSTNCPVTNAPDVDTAHLDRRPIGPIAHEWIAKGSAVGEAGADAVTLFDHVIHHNFRVGKRVEVVPKECFNARRTRLYICVVVVVLRVDELIRRVPRVYRLSASREEPGEMFVAHRILHDSKCTMMCTDGIQGY